MNNPYNLSDEEIYGKEPTWEEQEIERLKKENEKLKEENETIKDTINAAKVKLELEIQVNKRCLQEKDISDDAIFLFKQSKRFDEEILKILSDTNDS